MRQNKQTYFQSMRNGNFALRGKKTAANFVSILFIIFLLPNIANAASHYVAPNGTATWTQSVSINTPCSLATANANASAGDTIYLRAGTYSTAIAPFNQGTADDNPITYIAYPGETPIINGVSQCIVLENRDYITVDGITLKDPTGNAGWVNMRNERTPYSSDYNIIQNCTMTVTSDAGWAGIYLAGGVDFNKILNNTIVMGITKADCGFDELIYLDGMSKSVSYNLIEGNTLTGGTHNTIDLQTHGGTVNYNVIRNNTATNPLHSVFNIYSGSNYTLVENNIIKDAGDICDTDEDDTRCDENNCGSLSDRGQPRHDHPGLQFGSSYGIIRNNVIANNGHGMSLGKNSHDNRIYNNTFYKNCVGIDTNTVDPVYDNLSKNNIFYNNNLPGGQNREIRFTCTATEVDNVWVNNNLLGSVIYYYTLAHPWGVETLSYLQTNLPTLFYDNIALDPNFTDQYNHDFTLQSDSPMIDTGAWLTRITSASGNGTSFTVADGRYFYDGYGIPGETGDTIKIENGETAIITNVTGNTITVDRPISWTQNEGIALDYDGIKPDIGAHEYTSSTSGTTKPAPPTGLTVRHP